MGLRRVAGWSARQRSRQIVDALGGFARLEARGRRWATRWRASLGETDNVAEAIGLWVAREGGGEFWVPRAAADAWARESWTPADKRIADGVAWGVIDLLGSGPVKVGATPAWRRDLYTGREWPLRNAFRVNGARSRGDGSAIPTVGGMARGAAFAAARSGPCRAPPLSSRAGARSGPPATSAIATRSSAMSRPGRRPTPSGRGPTGAHRWSRRFARRIGCSRSSCSRAPTAWDSSSGKGGARLASRPGCCSYATPPRSAAH